jgi:hypothetical protein
MDSRSSDHQPVPTTIGWDGAQPYEACAICKRMIDPVTGEHAEQGD